MKNIVAYFDGSCDPNPGGNMACGYIVDDKTFHKKFKRDERNSCNLAEYCGVIGVLEELLKSKNKLDCRIFGDSMLVIKQMNGEWGVKQGGSYLKHFYMARGMKSELERRGHTLEFTWIPREENRKADKLSKYDFCKNS